MKYALCIITLVVGLLVGMRIDRGAGPTASVPAADTPAAKNTFTPAQFEALRAEIKKLNGWAPDQAAVMSHLAYHWSNLYFAVQNENWPLADFYLSETRSNLKWA